jgi:hypothetical protein
MLVPYRHNGPGADRSQDVRLLQIGRHQLTIRQDEKASGNCRALQEAQAVRIEWPQDEADGVEERRAAQQAGLPGASRGLQNVGYVVWQSGFVLAELLLRRPPFGSWPDVSVVDLGTGTGVVRAYAAPPPQRRGPARAPRMHACMALRCRRVGAAASWGRR